MPTVSSQDAGAGPAPAIAIVTHNSLAHLRRLFAGQVEVARRMGASIAVVDNRSTDGTIEFLNAWRDRYPELRLSFEHRNLGYSAAVNIAFQLLPGHDVMLANPDLELTEDGISELAGQLSANPNIAVCAPRLLYDDGTLQPSARRPASLAAMIGSLSKNGGSGGLFRRSYERYLAPAGSPGTGDVDWVIGAAMMIRRRAFDELGGFDPGFFLYMEDADFCRRCKAAGWRVVHLPWVSMNHEYARASSEHDASLASSPARRRHVRSLVRYWRKHPGALIGREVR